MFVKYEIIAPTSNEKYECELIDSEFSERFIAELYATGLDLVTPIIGIYENKKIPVAPNLAAFCFHVSKKFDVPTDKFIKNVAAANKNIIPYLENMQKYLILI